MSLRVDNDFSDVTLACEDGQQIETHKVILAASSPFFRDLLKRNRNPHPIIYMRGVKSETLAAIVDFLYCGEANVFPENLDSFLAFADELRLKGLMGQTENVEKKTGRNYADHTPGQINSKPFHKREQSYNEQRQLNLMQNFDQKPSNMPMNNDQRIAIPNALSGDLMELDEKVKSMMESSLNLAPNGREKAKICKVCRKEGYSVGIRDHIEANHLQGVSLPCNICEKTFRSRKLLRTHRCI